MLIWERKFIMSFSEKRYNDCVYMVSDVLSSRHMFTTRRGGVSTGVWDSWNFGENRGDDIECVRENYRRAGEIFGVSKDGFVITRQVHEAEVRKVSVSDRHVIGTAVPYNADGLVTNIKGQPILIFIADCVPVLMEDTEAGVIAAVHCGWKSSVADILGAAVEKMINLGAKPENIHAAIGASIGKCCFECDDDVPLAVEKYLGGDTVGLFEKKENGKTHVDLRGANERRLLQLGLKKENIDVSAECTMCSQDKYWSHRGTNGVRGSMAAVIML